MGFENWKPSTKYEKWENVKLNCEVGKQVVFVTMNV